MLLVNADLRARPDTRTAMAKKKLASKQSAVPKKPLDTARLMDRCRAGSQSAAHEVFGHYLARLTALARTRISPRLASRFDADDVVMSAYRSFFVGLRDGDFSVTG